MAICYGASVIRDGLLVYLDAANAKSYAGTGASWFDLSGNSYNSTLFNTPTYGSGNNGSFTFNGTTQYATVNNLTDILPDAAYTKIAWFNPSSLATSNNIISGGNSGQHAFWLNASNKLQAGHNGVWNIVVSLSSITAGNWYFGAVTFNTSTGWKLYFNGVQEATSVDTTVPTGDGRLYLAAYDAGNLFTGQISYACVYNRVLSNTEISSMYYATKGRYGL